MLQIELDYLLSLNSCWWLKIMFEILWCLQAKQTSRQKKPTKHMVTWFIHVKVYALFFSVLLLFHPSKDLFRCCHSSRSSFFSFQIFRASKSAASPAWHRFSYLVLNTPSDYNLNVSYSDVPWPIILKFSTH